MKRKNQPEKEELKIEFSYPLLFQDLFGLFIPVPDLINVIVFYLNVDERRRLLQKNLIQICKQKNRINTEISTLETEKELQQTLSGLKKCSSSYLFF